MQNIRYPNNFASHPVANLRASRSIIPNVLPGPGVTGLAASGLGHRYRRVVGVDLRGGRHIPANDFYEWTQQRSALADPVREYRTAELHAFARANHRLPIQDKVVTEFAGRNVRE
jgi:hypothetical protein